MPIIPNYINILWYQWKEKQGRTINHKKDLEYWPFSPAAETLIYMLIGALTTRAKAMSSQSKYQWNEVEWKKYTEYFSLEKEGGKIYAERIFCSAFLVRLSLGLCYVQNIKPILYKRVVSRLLIRVFYILSIT